MSCIVCQTQAKACTECLEKSNRDVIESLTANMEALQRLIDVNIQAETMTTTQINKYRRQYNKLSIERDILLFNKQKPDKKKPRFRNGLWL